MIRRKRMAAKALLFFFCKKEEGLMPLVLTPRASPAAPFRGAFAPSSRGHFVTFEPPTFSLPPVAETDETDKMTERKRWQIICIAGRD